MPATPQVMLMLEHCDESLKDWIDGRKQFQGVEHVLACLR